MIHLLGMCLFLMRGSGAGVYRPMPMTYVNPLHYPISQPQPVYPIKNVGPPIYPNVQQGYPNPPWYQQPGQGNVYPAPAAAPVVPAPLLPMNPPQNNRMVLIAAPTNPNPNPNTECECGMENTKPQENVNRLFDLNFNFNFNRIIGGDETLTNQYPWQVIIYSSEGPNVGNMDGWMMCGGSIISPIHILTAGHCVRNNTHIKHHLKPMTVYVGMHVPPHAHTSNDIKAEAKQVEEVFPHPKYTDPNNCDQGVYDYAIMKLKSPLVYSDSVKPICLPASPSPTYENQWAKVIGWAGCKNR